MNINLLDEKILSLVKRYLSPATQHIKAVAALEMPEPNLSLRLVRSRLLAMESSGRVVRASNSRANKITWALPRDV
jgi:hypothetical protein